jgi:hypothetical protein
MCCTDAGSALGLLPQRWDQRGDLEAPSGQEESVMDARRTVGGVVAVLFCPCHLPVYILLISALGVSSSLVVGFLLPTLVFGFLGGLLILTWPEPQETCCKVQLQPLQTP